MSKQQQEKSIPFVKPDTPPNTPFVQAEGKLTEAQLEAIAVGGIELN